MLAYHLIVVMWANGYTLEQTAENYGLPVEAVREALAYLEANQDWIHAENRLLASGLPIADECHLLNHWRGGDNYATPRIL